MNIILGAGGQVGSRVAALLEQEGMPVRRVFHHAPEQTATEAKNSETAVADYFDRDALTEALRDGNTVLLLTPESMTSENMLEDAKRVLANYTAALEHSGIKRVVGLSSGGAQLTAGTGTMQLYALLEETLHSLAQESYIVRPAYYYSNWMMYLDTAKSEGVLPTFFPVNHAIPMIAPADVAAFVADLISKGTGQRISEITGPEPYTPCDIARMMGAALGREVTAMQIPREHWLPGLRQAGFSQSSAEYLVDMTQSVIDGKTGFTTVPIQMGTTFADYLGDCLQNRR